MKNLVLIHTLLLIMFSMGCTLQSQNVTSPVMRMSEPEYKIFLRQFFEYPEDALMERKNGTVYIDFNCDRNGWVTNKRVSGSVSPSVDSTALALFDLIVWEPLPSGTPKMLSNGSLALEFNTKKFTKLAKQRGYKSTPPIHLPADSSGKIYLPDRVNTPAEYLTTNNNPTLADFINHELTYPESAKKLGLAGTVTLSFVIELNGMPSNIHAEHYVGGGCTEEAIRLVSSIKWKPAMVNGKYVRSYNKLNITYQKGRNNAIYIPNQNNSGI